MAFLIEQKIKGKTYLYEVESYYDKDKKQPRQRRKYLGRKPSEKSVKIQDISSLTTKNFGNIFLLEEIAKKLGLTEIVSIAFPEHYNELLYLAFYKIIEAEPYYLFEHWFDEQYSNKCKRMEYQSISRFTSEIEKMQNQQYQFFELWTKHLSPIETIYYDITSISSYSENIDFVEWSYNRDGEQLPQINLGVVSCKRSSLPIFYRTYQGSIVDVSTLKNTVKYFKSFDLTDIILVTDKGFYSGKNITELKNSEFQFIIPLPYTLKKSKGIVKKYFNKITSPKNAFQYKNDVLYYQSDIIEIEKNNYYANIYFNEKRKVEQNQIFLNKILDIENQYIKNQFSSRKQYNDFKKDKLGSNAKYFKYNIKTQKLERNENTLKTDLAKMGFFIMLTNKELDKTQILDYYRNKDMVEKIFDNLKNELDENRLKTHNQTNTEARLFINFLSLILYSLIVKTMQNKKLIKKFTVKEIFAELKKIKITTIKNQKPFLSEITKTQKIFFDAFDIKCQI